MSNDLAKLSKPELIKAADGMKRRALKYKKNADTLAGKLVEALVGLGAAGVVGSMMGRREGEWEDMVEKHMADEGASREDAEKALADKDPRKFMGMDLDLSIGVAGLVVGLTGIGGKKVSSFVEQGAKGPLFGWAYNKGSERALKAHAASKEEEAA